MLDATCEGFAVVVLDVKDGIQAAARCLFADCRTAGPRVHQSGNDLQIIQDAVAAARDADWTAGACPQCRGRDRRFAL